MSSTSTSFGFLDFLAQERSSSSWQVATKGVCAAAALAVVLGLASCGTSSPSPQVARAPTAEAKGLAPARPDSAAALSVEERALPDMPPPGASLDRTMHAHFHDALLIRQAMVAGRPEHAVAPARLLAVAESEEAVPASWREFVVRLQEAARRISGAGNAEQAASATADLARSCGECHRELGGPHVTNEIPPPTGTTTDAWMSRHLWASERLWEGLVVPSGDAWNAGLEALGRSVPPELLGGGSQARRAGEDFSNLVARAPRATGAEERAAVYAELLLTCGSCHRAVKQRRTE